MLRAGTWFLLLVLCGFSTLTYAQVRTIKGTVTTSDTKETLPGATIVIKGTTSGTATDLDGNFTLNVPAGGAVLVVSYVGYNAKEIPIGAQDVYDIVLEPSKVSLDEVVVIGYGTVRKSDLTGSVSSLKSDDITKITALNPVQSLQGKVTGVQVTSASGTPGESPVVRVRGVGTFNNASPIYVVDGVILDDISFLNSGDITSMEVLKDASATAIYGSRGANGVILITTKSGKGAADKTVITLSAELGIQNLAREIDLLSGREFAIISNEIKPGSYNNVDAVPNTNWQDLIFHSAPVYNVQLAASGSGKLSQYYISLSYFNQDGIIDKSNYERITFKLNNIFNLSKYVRFGNNITLAPFDQQIAPDVTYAAYRAQPLLEPYYDDGSFAVVYNVGNPLASLKYSNNFVRGFRGVGNLYGEVDFLKMFTFKSSFGLDAGYYKAESYTPAYTVYNPDGTASQQDFPQSKLVKGSNDILTWLWENTLTFKKAFGKHTVDALAGYTMQNTSSENFNVEGMNVIRDASSFWYIKPSYVYDLNNDINTINMMSNLVDPNQYYSMISYLFRINYTFANRYILTATYRRDGSSKFSKENRYSDFPSFAAGWNISQENFMKDINWLSKLKVRASWGKIGNEKIQYWDRYSRVIDLITIFGTQSVSNPAATYGATGNPNLRWEVSTQWDAGLETGLFKDKLTGEFDYYHRVTDDVLVLLSVPGYFGNGQGEKVRFNAASVLNEGFEFNLAWKHRVNKFYYSVGFLGSTVHNEVLAVGGSEGVDSVLIGGYLANGIPVTSSSVGLPIGAFYGYKTDGIFQSQAELDAYPHDPQAGVGDLRFVDVNHDGVINGLDRTTGSSWDQAAANEYQSYSIGLELKFPLGGGEKSAS